MTEDDDLEWPLCWRCRRQLEVRIVMTGQRGGHVEEFFCPVCDQREEP